MIPNLPTDNLYKFIATFGLALLVTGLVLTARMADEVVVTNAQLLSRLDQLTEEGERLDRFHSALDEYGYEEIPSSLARMLADELSAYIEARHTLDLDADEFIGRGERLVAWWYLGHTAIGLGLVLIVAGFYLWYHRVQKPLDQSLRDRIAAATDGQIEIARR